MSKEHEVNKVEATVPSITDVKSAAAALQNDPSMLNQLLTVLLLKEAREAKESQAKAETKAAKEAQRAKNASHTAEADLRKQAVCKHMKGGRRGPRGGVKDYAVAPHRFIDNTVVIKCQLCGMKWKKDDTDEFLIRKNKKGGTVSIKNHTHIGWQRAMSMASETTNTATFSEMPLDATPRVTMSEPISDQERVTYEM